MVGLEASYRMNLEQHLRRLHQMGNVLTGPELEQCRLRCKYMNTDQVRTVIRYVDAAVAQAAMTRSPDLRRRVGRAFFLNVEHLYIDLMRTATEG